MDMLPRDWAARQNELYTGRFQEGADYTRVHITSNTGKQSVFVIYDYPPVDGGHASINQDLAYTVVVLDPQAVNSLNVRCGRLVMLIDGVAKMRIAAQNVNYGVFLADDPRALEVDDNARFQRQDAIRDKKTLNGFREQIRRALEDQETSKLLTALFAIYTSTEKTLWGDGAAKFFGLA